LPQNLTPSQAGRQIAPEFQQRQARQRKERHRLDGPDSVELSHPCVCASCLHDWALLLTQLLLAQLLLAQLLLAQLLLAQLLLAQLLQAQLLLAESLHLAIWLLQLGLQTPLRQGLDMGLPPHQLKQELRQQSEASLAWPRGAQQTQPWQSHASVSIQQSQSAGLPRRILS